MTSILSRLGAAALLAMLAACASHPSRFDRQFGVAAKATLQQQIIRPGPPASQYVGGLDGQAAKSANDNYQKSFRDPVPQTGALSIGVGR
jgi:hypothetical protein